MLTVEAGLNLGEGSLVLRVRGFQTIGALPLSLLPSADGRLVGALALLPSGRVLRLRTGDLGL